MTKSEIVNLIDIASRRLDILKLGLEPFPDSDMWIVAADAATPLLILGELENT